MDHSYRRPARGISSSDMAPSSSLYFACSCSYMAALSFGYTIGFTSPALPQMTKEGPLNQQSASWFGSLMTIGAMLGCPLAGFLVERLGRKGTLMINTLPYFLGWAIIWGSSDIGLLYLGRFLTGLGCGMTTVTSPMYIAEIATKDLRGMLGSGVQLAITTGILMVYVAGSAMGWRALAFGGLCLPVIAVVLTMRVADTPRYYLSRGHKQEALKTLSWLRGAGVDVSEECRDMEDSLDTGTESISFKDFFKQDLYLPLRVSVGLMIFQQLSGINVVMFYTVDIFQSAGYGESGNMATIVVGVVQVIVTVAACMLMDRAGRRFLLMISGVGMMLSCIALGWYYSMVWYDQTMAVSYSWVALVSLVLYVIAFSIGWGPIPMLIMAEIFPVRARGSASAVASVTNWLFAFLVTKEFTVLQYHIGQGGVFYLYSGCILVGLCFVYKLVPETKGKSLEDIELFFMGQPRKQPGLI